MSIIATGSDRHDSVLLQERVIPWNFGHYEKIPETLYLDAGYVGKADAVEYNGMTAHIRPGSEEKTIELQGFKPKRRLVEVAHSRFRRYRKIHIRYEKTIMAYTGLLHFAAIMITRDKITRIYPAL